MTTIDFAKALQDAKGASFEALPVGDYDVEVAKAEAVTSSTGKPMVKVQFKVVSGPYERRTILNQFVLSIENPQAVAIFFRHMKAFGLTEEWFASLGRQPSMDPVASALVGRRARLNVGQRDWQGETRNEVKAVKPYTGAPPPPAGPVAGPTAGPPAGGPAPLPPAAPPLPGPTTPPAPPVTPPPAPEPAVAASAVPTSSSPASPPAPATAGGEAAPSPASPLSNATSSAPAAVPPPPPLPY